jgi:uncharacterized protein (TIGR02594 family)
MSDSAYWKKIQLALKEKGFNPGPIDGEPGPQTSEAIIDFKKSLGFQARDYIGPLTEAALLQAPNNPKPVDDRPSEPVWLRRARQEIGVQEIPGSRHSAKVLGYWERSKLYFDSDEIPWCAGFVGAMLEDCGIKCTRSGMARSYENWGQPCKAIPGAVVVFWRGSKNGGSGHVGFVTGKDQHGNIMVLGGNQGDAVNIKPFDTSRVVGYRWPAGVPLGGGATLTTVTSDGKTSQNEA